MRHESVEQIVARNIKTSVINLVIHRRDWTWRVGDDNARGQLRERVHGVYGR